MRESRRLVYVSGAPGSGKTSLAVPLAAELGWALLTKDRIKETLHDALEPPEPDREWSRRLGATAMAEYDRPVGIGALVRVDTTRPVDVVGMAKEVRGQLGA
jgi:predicted kinase